MINWLYPERCPVCLRLVMPKGAGIHSKCRDKLDKIKEPACFKCGMPLSSKEEEYCLACTQEQERGWDLGRSIFPYHGVMESALQLVKKEGTDVKPEYRGVSRFSKHYVPEDEEK